MNGLTCMTRLYYAPYTPTAMPGLWGKPQLLADELRYKKNLPETLTGLQVRAHLVPARLPDARNQLNPARKTIASWQEVTCHTQML